MSDFKPAFTITNGTEGGWQNDPNDNGNAANGLGTYRGIASAKQQVWHGWSVVKAAIVSMTKQPLYDTDAYHLWVHKLNATLAANTALQTMVLSFFESGFWDVNRLGDLASQAVSNKVYDSGVNQGTGTAARLLQECLGVAVDGDVGDKTLAAANALDGTALAQTFKLARIAHYRETVAKNPNDAQYLDDWISRC
jgi:lysozyme family protein